MVEPNGAQRLHIEPEGLTKYKSKMPRVYLGCKYQICVICTVFKQKTIMFAIPNNFHK